MTVRQRILNSIYTGLNNIKEVNGYNNTITGVKKGYFALSSITEYPTAMIYLGRDVEHNALKGKQIEGSQNGTNIVDVAVLVFVECSPEEQVDKAENMIEDLQKYFNLDENIESKYVSDLIKQKYVQSYKIAETNPYITGSNTIVVVGMLLKVEFINFIDTD